MNLKQLVVTIFITGTTGFAFSQYPPAAGEDGTTAISNDSSIIINWASEVAAFNRGLEDYTNPEGLLASFGEPIEALGYAEGTSVDVVSLGDFGSIVLAFPFSIRNEEGPDFAVFENSFSDEYLEFAHVEVSTDGVRFVRIPSYSAIQTEIQTETFGSSLAEEVHNLAGKYRQGFGTPFDLADVADSTGIDILDIQFVKIIDVIGSVDPSYGTQDSEGNFINDPFKTDFESGGFDLDGVGVIHSNNPSLGLKEFESDHIRIYPNPTNGWLFIQSNAVVQSVQIHDLQGKLVFQQQGEDTIDLAHTNLIDGFYLVTIESVDGTKQQSKLMLRR